MEYRNPLKVTDHEILLLLKVHLLGASPINFPIKIESSTTQKYRKHSSMKKTPWFSSAINFTRSPIPMINNNLVQKKRIEILIKGQQ